MLQPSRTPALARPDADAGRSSPRRRSASRRRRVRRVLVRPPAAAHPRGGLRLVRLRRLRLFHPHTGALRGYARRHDGRARRAGCALDRAGRRRWRRRCRRGRRCLWQAAEVGLDRRGRTRARATRSEDETRADRRLAQHRHRRDDAHFGAFGRRRRRRAPDLFGSCAERGRCVPRAVTKRHGAAHPLELADAEPERRPGRILARHRRRLPERRLEGALVQMSLRTPPHQLPSSVPPADYNLRRRSSASRRSKPIRTSSRKKRHTSRPKTPIPVRRSLLLPSPAPLLPDSDSYRTRPFAGRARHARARAPPARQGARRHSGLQQHAVRHSLLPVSMLRADVLVASG
jgi:hypothetical protein